jgi:L-lactate dehydrogenase
MEMVESSKRNRKVVITGAGAVGSTYAYALAQSGIADEIIMIDKNEELAKGQVMDLVQGQPFFPTVDIRTGSPEDYSDAQLVVITAGAAQRPGETRLQLLRKNADIVGRIADDVANSGCGGVMVVVSNPVDVLTWVALKSSGWNRSRVLGSGTVLDSARFRHFLARHCGVDVHNVHAYFLGEHGDSEFAAWSMTHVAGIKIDEYCPVCENYSDWKEERKQIEQHVRHSAYHIIDSKGFTQFAVGLALVRITGAILRSQHSVLSVSTYVDGEFGISDVCLSLPCIVSHDGIRQILVSPLPDEEKAALANSAGILKQAIASLEG